MIAEIKAELDKATNEVRELIDTQKKELRTIGATQEKTAERLTGFEEQVAELSGTLAKAQEKLDEFEVKLGRNGRIVRSASDEEIKSLGTRFVDDEAVASFLESIGSGTKFSQGFEVKGGFSAYRDANDAGRMLKALLTTDPASVGAALDEWRVAGVFAPPFRVPRIRNLLPVNRVGAGVSAIEYVEESEFSMIWTELTANATSGSTTTLAVTNAVGFKVGSTVTIGAGTAQEETAVVDSKDVDAKTITLTAAVTQNHTAGMANATVTATEYEFTAEGNFKPTADMKLEEASAKIHTLATAIFATRQAIEDVDILRAHIDSRLMESLALSEEKMILYGDGSSTQLQGILTNPRRQEFDWSTAPGGTTRMDGVRRMITLAALSNYPTSGIVCHPLFWQEVVLAKDSNGRYINDSVMGGNDLNPRLWGLPVIPTTAINPTDVLVGGFSLGAALWDREQGTIAVSDQHANFFLENKVAIRAEERVALTTYRPEAFVHGDYSSAPAP